MRDKLDRRLSEKAVPGAAMAENGVDSAVTRGLSPEEVADLKEAFSNFDRNSDGSIDKVELATVLRSLGYSPTAEQLTKLMNKVKPACLLCHACRAVGAPKGAYLYASYAKQQ